MTYPEPEGTSSGILNAGAQVFGILNLFFERNISTIQIVTFHFLLGILFTMLYSEILEKYGDISANLVMSAFLIVGSIITFLIKSDLRRQNARATAPPSA